MEEGISKIPTAHRTSASIPGAERSLCRCLGGCELKLERQDLGLANQVCILFSM